MAIATVTAWRVYNFTRDLSSIHVIYMGSWAGKPRLYIGRALEFITGKGHGDLLEAVVRPKTPYYASKGEGVMEKRDWMV